MGLRDGFVPLDMEDVLPAQTSELRKGFVPLGAEPEPEVPSVPGTMLDAIQQMSPSAPAVEEPTPDKPSMWEKFDNLMSELDMKREDFLRKIESPETWKAVKEWAGAPTKVEDIAGTREYAKEHGVPLLLPVMPLGLTGVAVAPEGVDQLQEPLPAGPKHPYQVLLENADKIFSGKGSPRDLRQLGEWGLATSKVAQTGVDEVIHQLDQFRNPLEWAQHREEEADAFTREWFTKAASDFPKVVGYDLPKAMLYDVPKQFTDPVLKYAHALQEGRKYGQGAEVPEAELLKDLGTATWMTLQGFAEWTVKPLPAVGWLAYGYEEWKNYWQKDPATALAGVASVVAPAIRARMGGKEGAYPRPGEMETHENVIKSARIKDEIEAHARKYEEMFEGLDEPMLRTKQEADVAMEKLQAQKVSLSPTEEIQRLVDLGAKAEGVYDLPDGVEIVPEKMTPKRASGFVPDLTKGEVISTRPKERRARDRRSLEELEVDEFVGAVLSGNWYSLPVKNVIEGVKYKEAAAKKRGDTKGEALYREAREKLEASSIKWTKPPKIEGFTQLRNGTLVRPSGTPFPTRANANVARKKLKKEGLEYEVEKLDEGKYILRSETPGEAKAMAQVEETIQKLERDIPESKGRRERTQEGLLVEEAVDELNLELSEVIPGPERGTAHPFEWDLDHSRRQDALATSRLSSLKTNHWLRLNALRAKANLWRHGEDIPIEKVSDLLKSEALEADRLVNETTQTKQEVKSLATELWVWVERMRKERSGGGDPGTTLYSGIPLPSVQKVKDMYQGVTDAKRSTLRDRISKRGEKARKAFVDTQGNLKNAIEQWSKSVGDSPIGNYVNNKIILARGGGARAADQMKLYNKLIYSRLSEKERESLDNIIFSRRVIQLDKHEVERVAAGKKARAIKHPGGLGSVEHRQFLDHLRGELGDATYNKLWSRADHYFDAMREELKELHKEGIISDKAYDRLKDFDYQPRQNLMNALDPKIHLGKFKSKMDVRDSGVESLKYGSEFDLLEKDSRILLEDRVARGKGRIYRNRANQAMADLAKQYPDNPFIREKRPNEYWHPVKFYEEGKRKTYYMPRQWADEWLLRETDITYTAAQWMRVLSGSSILRPMATGINPGFAFTNVLRDAAHFWAVGNYMDKGGKWKSVYNPALAPMQMGRDIARVFNDAVTRAGRYVDFIEDGGGMEFLTQQGSMVEHRMGHKRPLEGMQNVLGYLNMTSELMMRLAFREGAISRIARREGLTKAQIHSEMKYRKFREEATAVSRDYLDFGQGGSVAKAADSAVPYLNAATQATRGIFRTATRNPQGAIAKAGMLGATAMSLYLAQRYQAPEAMKNMSQDELRRNWVFFPFGDQPFYDADGQKRFVYLKFPKDQGQQFFATASEFLARKMMGDEVPEPGQIVESLKEMSPADMSSLPPTLSAMIAYFLNVDTWSGNPIWRGADVKSSEEYREDTPAYAVKVGQLTGMSPEKFNAALGEVFTNGNAYTYLMGYISNKLMSDMPEDNRQEHMAMWLSHAPIAKRFIGVTSSYTKHREMVDDVSEDVATERWKATRSFDVKLKAYYDYGNMEKKDLTNYLKSFKDPAVVDRLVDRWKFFKQVRGLEERSLWLRMHAKNPEERARIFHNIWSDADEEQKEVIKREIAQVPGIITDEFKRYYGQLRGQ